MASGSRWTFASLVCAAVVAGCGGGGDTEPEQAQDGGPDAGDARTPQDGGADAAKPAPRDGGPSPVDPCASMSCSPGQACAVVDDAAVCEGSCDDVACAADRTCEVRDGVGTCVALCEPACGSGQRCEVDAVGVGRCEDNTCAELDCGPKQACVPAPEGSGNVCVDNSCEDDLDCAANAHCDASDGVCIGDVCEPGVRRCESDSVMECAPNGSGEITRVTCAGAGDYQSECSELDSVGGCGCRGDWDCPAFTACVVGRCEGTGREPTCFLPPLPFEDVLPTQEPGFPWGGDDTDGYSGSNAADVSSPPSRWAWGSPFPRHAQVSSAPVVANLDDDNGDGLINELDFPEILFTSFCHQNYFDNGVLRALHGGGSAPGTHLFAVCDDTLWQEGDPVFEEGTDTLAAGADCACNGGSLEPTGGLAVGDVDGDGVPEIALLSDGDNGVLHLYANTGERISTNAVTPVGGAGGGSNPAVAIANVDGEGMAEIVAGRALYVLGRGASDELVVAHALVGNQSVGKNNGQGPSSCLADLDGDGRMEIVAGGTAYRVPVAPAAGCPMDTAGLSGDEAMYCNGQLDVLWDHGTEGFCAIADVLGSMSATGDPEVAPGPSAPLDGLPEVLLIVGGRLRVLDGLTGAQRLDVVLDDRDGGPPNVDDFDGDGFPEVATAFDTKYVVHDFQAPSAGAGSCPAWNAVLDGLPGSPDPINQAGGNAPRTPAALGCVTDADCGDPDVVCGSDKTCVCLHNGWASTTQDASSRVTGSSVFDFNGDGKAEVVYNDECFFRIYEGPTGRVYQRLPSQSPTRIEYPVVADVDNDGNAEVVFSSSNARSESCPGEGLGDYVNGIQVIGEPEDRWVSARRIWNQHSYHITNVLEGGGIPASEPDSWLAYGGRRYDTYRSNLPPLGNVAPDLVVTGVQVSSPDVACGDPLSDTIRITARVENQGDLRVGPGVVVAFTGDAAALGSQTLDTSLEPGAAMLVSLVHVASSAAALPQRVRVEVDAEGDASFGSERECNEGNNAMEADVVPGQAVADLRITTMLLSGSCPNRSLRVTVFNDGAKRVDAVVVRAYAGNPSAGGTPIGEELVLGPIAPGEASAPEDLDVSLVDRNVTIYTVVDPDAEISECDDANNSASVAIECEVELI